LIYLLGFTLDERLNL